GRRLGWLGGGRPNAVYRIELFASASPAQAEDYLGSLEVTTDPSGQAAFAVPFAPPDDKPILSATATDPLGNTSGLSNVREPTLAIPAGMVPHGSGSSLTFSAATGNAIALADPDAGPLAVDPRWDLSLKVSDGTLSLSGIVGLSGSGDGTDSLHYQGTISALDAALEGLRYSWPAGFQGVVTVSVDAQSD